MIVSQWPKLLRGAILVGASVTASLTPCANSAALGIRPIASESERAIPMGPWSPHFERELVDALTESVSRLAPTMLALNPDEERTLRELIEERRRTLVPKLTAWKRSVEEWNQKFEGINVEADPAAWLHLCCAREVALAPLADQQAAFDREFLDALRDRFSGIKPELWYKFEYSLEISRTPMPGHHLETGSVDLVALLDKVLEAEPNAASDGAQISAQVSLYCERYLVILRKMRESAERIARTTSRRQLRQMEKQSANPEGPVRTESMFRVADAAYSQLGQSASALAELVLASQKQIAESLSIPARRAFLLAFWSDISRRHELVFWPASMEGFRSSLLAVASDEERKAVDSLFDEGFRAAVDRITIDEAWIRHGREAEYRGRTHPPDTAGGLRGRQELGCKALNSLCASALSAVDPGRRAGLKEPGYGLPPKPAASK